MEWLTVLANCLHWQNTFALQTIYRYIFCLLQLGGIHRHHRHYVTNQVFHKLPGRLGFFLKNLVSESVLHEGLVKSSVKSFYSINSLTGSLFRFNFLSGFYFVPSSIWLLYTKNVVIVVKARISGLLKEWSVCDVVHAAPRSGWAYGISGLRVQTAVVAIYTIQTP